MPIRAGRNQCRLAVVVVLIGLSEAGVSRAQSVAGVGPAPRPLPAPSITSPQFAGYAFNLIALPDGRLLVNDIRNHRVMLSDSLLRQTTVVIESAEYGSAAAALLAHPGDSAVFVEGVTPSMTLIDPSGKVVRSMAVQNARDVLWLMPTPLNLPGVDARGRLVHRGVAPRAELPKMKPGETRYRTLPDSQPIIRDNPAAHAGDTVTWVKSTRLRSIQMALADGRTFSYTQSHPVDIIDDWAMLSSGRLAVVRGRDYHIDLFDPNGKVTALPRIPYGWEHLTDDAKVALADSVNREREEAMKTPPKAMAGGGSAAGSGGGMGGLPPNRADLPPPPPGSLDAKAADIPDYRAVFELASVRADAEDNLWIKTAQRVGDTTKVVYDVVSSGGELIDRISVPKDRAIIGFDRGGNVFLVGQADGGIQWIERVRWRK